MIDSTKQFDTMWKRISQMRAEDSVEVRIKIIDKVEWLYRWKKISTEEYAKLVSFMFHKYQDFGFLK